MKKIIIIVSFLISLNCLSQTKNQSIAFSMGSGIRSLSDFKGFYVEFNEKDTSYSMIGDTTFLVKLFFDETERLRDKLNAADALIMSYNCTWTNFTPKQQIKHDKAQKKYVKLMGYKISKCCKDCK